MTATKMLQIECRGTPYEIGFTHGSEAKVQIERCIAFYADLFVKYSNQQWPQVQETARGFDAEIKRKWPRYHEEIRGIADGSKRDILDIIALNVRTEIAFGLFSDGCTSLFWKTPEHTFLGQNWDWMEPQKKNLIIATIHPSASSPHLPTIKMITEAGMIGKIGHNSSGVGVCFNAIRASGLAVTRIPVHLGLRMALESSSAAEAVAKLEKEGMASSAHMLIADQGQGVGCEFTSTTFQKLEPDKLGRVVHSNHLLLKHKDVYEPPWLADSPFRVEKMTELTNDTAAKAATKTNGEVKGKGGEGVGWEDFEAVFRDESNYPNAICRAQVGDSTTASLFNIVMDLKERKAIVRLGRPCQVEETVELKFD